MEQKIATKLYNHFKERISIQEILGIISKYNIEELQKRETITALINLITLRLDNTAIPASSITINTNYNEVFPERIRHHDETQLIARSSITRSYDIYIMIDSKDRDMTTYSKPNCFTVELPNAISDIYSVELINCIIKDSRDCIELTNTPYLLLVLDELGHGIEATNIVAGKAFGILSDYKLLDGYRYYNVKYGNMNFCKKFPTAITLTRLTVKIKNMNGDICEFPEDNKTATTTIQLILKLTCGK
jgi:hypothetical protein